MSQVFSPLHLPVLMSMVRGAAVALILLIQFNMGSYLRRTL